MSGCIRFWLRLVVNWWVFVFLILVCILLCILLIVCLLVIVFVVLVWFRISLEICWLS